MSVNENERPAAAKKRAAGDGKPTAWKCSAHFLIFLPCKWSGLDMATAAAPTRVELMLGCANKLHLHSPLESKQILTKTRLATSGLFDQSISAFFLRAPFPVFISTEIFRGQMNRCTTRPAAGAIKLRKTHSRPTFLSCSPSEWNESPNAIFFILLPAIDDIIRVYEPSAIFQVESRRVVVRTR